MAKARSALPYLETLLEDEYVQDQIRDAVAGARSVYLRARRQRAEAVQDKGLYKNLRHTATAMRRAARALPPDPEPRRRGRKLAATTLAIAATATLTARLQKQYARVAVSER